MTSDLVILSPHFVDAVLSLGAMIGQWLAVNAPRRLTRLVLSTCEEPALTVAQLVSVPTW